MSKASLALFAVALMVIVAVPGVMATDAGENPIQLTLHGQVLHGNIPTESPNNMNFTVYHFEDMIYKEDKFHTTKLSSTGEFDIEISNFYSERTYYMHIEEDGYSIVGWPETMVEDQTLDSYRLVIDTEKIQEGNKYNLTERGHYIIMNSAVGTLKGKIVSSSGGNPALNGVKVTITSLTTNYTYTTFTHGNGNFYFDKVRTGTYKLVAESKGFDTYTIDKIEITMEGYEMPTTIEMTPNNNVDTAHWMTIGGIVAALLLLLATVVHIMKEKKKRSSNE